MKYSATAAFDAAMTSPILFRGDFYRSIIKAKSIGYDAMEFHIRNMDEIDDVRMSEFCKKHDIAISTIGTGMGYTVDRLSLTNMDSSVRKAAVERLKNYIMLASRLKTNVIIGSMRGRIPADEDYAVCMEHYRDGITELTDYAEKQGVLLFLEAINRYEVNFHSTVEEMACFIKSIGSPALKMLVDTFHMNIEETDTVECIEKHSSSIGHIHFADNNRWYPGKGHVDFKKIIDTLVKVGYGGYIALECLPYPNPDAAAGIGLEFLRSL